MPEETLLPLHREFTYKEKYEWMKKQYNQERAVTLKMLYENSNLISTIKRLENKIDEHERDIPFYLNGAKTVTAKTYCKLLKHFKNMTAAYWKVNDELLELKKNLPSEKL